LAIADGAPSYWAVPSRLLLAAGYSLNEELATAGCIAPAAEMMLKATSWPFFIGARMH